MEGDHMLPSQTQISGSGRSNMYRRRRNTRKPILIGVAAVVALAVVVWMFTRGGGDRPGQPSEIAATQPALGPQSAAASPVTTSSPRITNPAPAPVVREEPPPPVVELRQGRPENAGRAEPAPTTRSEVSRAEMPVATASPTAALPVTTPPAPSVAKPSNATPSPQITNMAAASGPLGAAQQAQAAGDLVLARALYSRALADSRSPTERAGIRAELTRLNDELVFSRRVVAGDPYAYFYTIQSGDSLARIRLREGLSTDWRLIQRINGISHPNRIQLGQNVKLLRGPFHAIVRKSEFRLDLYMGPPESEDQWLYIRSFPVGLGDGGSTPTGTFVVRRNSKLINPDWTNPRTGEHFASNDPKNPIGNRWIGLDGIGDAAGYAGYGLHGTIEPESIGREMSMGCVRLADGDIELVYELLGEQVSVVIIEP
jgi:hypothetical protein